MKQIILIRKDLKMRLGKAVAQGAHASMGAVLEYMDHPYVKEWLANAFTKIALHVDSVEDLHAACNAADAAGIPYYLITDNGRTEFHGVPTITAAAIGPGPAELIDPITGQFKLA